MLSGPAPPCSAGPARPSSHACRKKAATALKGVVGVGAVDADAHKDLAKRFEVRVGEWNSWGLGSIVFDKVLAPTRTWPSASKSG